MAGLTLTIEAGSTSGKSATGSITVSGSEQTYTFNPCPQNQMQYCGGESVTVPGSGSVIATINGEIFSTTYGQGSTPQYIAMGLAAAMNYPDSPVAATVLPGAGNTYLVSITSSILGAMADFPISATSTFNSSCNESGLGQWYCFYSPAFAAQASGNTLVGGTN